MGQRPLQLIPTMPESPATFWLEAFFQALIELKPGLGHDDAMRCAMLAHASTWLLDPTEAAACWVAAIEMHLAQRLRSVH